MDYIIGSLYILKDKVWDKIWYLDFINVPRTRPKLPWHTQYKHFYSESNYIIPNLYLGSSFNAYSTAELTDKRINVIINVTNEINNFHEHNPNITYYRFSIKDNNQDDLLPILGESFDVIDRHLNNGDRILVHCFMGASRSASVVMYYLMRRNKISYYQAHEIVSSKRELVNLSEKFNDTLQSIDYLFTDAHNN